MTLLRTIFAIFAISLIWHSQAGAIDTLKIAAQLDTLNNEISGSVSYVLPDNADLRSVEFQLFANVYSSENTPYLKNRRLLVDTFKKTNRWGGTAIDSIFLDRLNLSSGLKISGTRAVLTCPGIDSLGGRRITIFFKTTIPTAGDRLFQFGRGYLLDGWFPSPAILNKDGSWYNPEYDSFSELVGEYYQYDVSITVPSDFILAVPATPIESSMVENGKMYRYLFGPVHDFPIITSPDFLADSMIVGNAKLKFYYRDFERPILDIVKESAGDAFAYMEEHVGQYQYSNLNLVFVDFDFTGGMEMPGLVALSSPRYMLSFPDAYYPLVSHEIIHQWFYGMIGSNQIECPWMDEAISDYLMEKIDPDCKGKLSDWFSRVGINISNVSYNRISAETVRESRKVNSPTYDFISEHEYFGVVYFKGGLAIATLDNLMGDSLSAMFWKEYYKRFLFRHPNYNDFYQTVYDIAGPVAAKLAEDLLNQPVNIDLLAESLTNRRIDSISVEAKFILSRKGSFIYPVDYCLITANSDTIWNIWSSDEYSREFVDTLPVPIAEVIIDPVHKYALDPNYLNNSIIAVNDNRPGFRLSSGIMFLIESLMSFIGGF
jgi:hypothetical protein